MAIELLPKVQSINMQLFEMLLFESSVNQRSIVQSAIFLNVIGQNALILNALAPKNRAASHKWFCISQITVAYRPRPPFA